MNVVFILKKMKKILVTFWGHTDNSKKELQIYSYTFLYIITILTYPKNYFYLYTIEKKIIMKNSTFSLVA